jgi:hypothetical protein
MSIYIIIIFFSFLKLRITFIKKMDTRHHVSLISYSLFNTTKKIFIKIFPVC